MGELEKAARVATKRNRDIGWLPYKEGINRPRLLSLEEKWLMVDMVNAYSK